MAGEREVWNNAVKVGNTQVREQGERSASRCCSRNHVLAHLPSYGLCEAFQSRFHGTYARVKVSSDYV